MANKPFLKTREYQLQQWRAVVEGAHPIMLEFPKLLVRRMARLDVPMYAHCVVRTVEEQRRVFKEGLTKVDPEKGVWPHQGLASDVVHSTVHWGLHPEQWLLVGHVGKELAAQRGWDLEWGGDWRRKPTDKVGWDPAHWQVRGWRQLVHQYPWPI